VAGEIEIRRVRPDEAEAAGQLVEAVYRRLDGLVMEPDYARELADVAGRMDAGVVLVALVDGRLVGCVTYVPDASSPLAEDLRDGEAGVRMLAVHPAAQRRGIGRALTIACIERARAAGRRGVFLHSDRQMPAAHALYRSLGFRAVPDRDWSPPPAYELRAFALDLEPPGRD
jgi:ribosomal protein S18 acetylase RimI-like enzyme